MSDNIFLKINIFQRVGLIFPAEKLGYQHY